MFVDDNNDNEDDKHMLCLKKTEKTNHVIINIKIAKKIIRSNQHKKTKNLIKFNEINLFMDYKLFSKKITKIKKIEIN